MTKHERSKITVSIVSHGHGVFVQDLLADLNTYCADAIEVILTINIPENQIPAGFDFPLKIIHNTQPKGFAENHNTAFTFASTDYYCVLNPDIRLRENPFERLTETLRDEQVGVVAPLVRNPDDLVADSARKFPTPWRLL